MKWNCDEASYCQYIFFSSDKSRLKVSVECRFILLCFTMFIFHWQLHELQWQLYLGALSNEMNWAELNWNEMMLFGAIPEWVEDRPKKFKCSFVAFCQFVQKNNSSYKNKNVLVNSISISLFHFRFRFCSSSTKFKWKSC